jgi:hypothetical protein
VETRGTTDVWLARLPRAVRRDRRAAGDGPGAARARSRRRTSSRAVWISTWFIVDEYRKAMATRTSRSSRCCRSGRGSSRTAATPGRAQSRTQRAPGPCLSRYVSAALGTLAKGPIILVHLALALIPYHGIYRRRRPYSNPIPRAGRAPVARGRRPWPAMVAQRSRTRPVWIAQLRAEQATSGEKIIARLELLPRCRSPAPRGRSSASSASSRR